MEETDTYVRIWTDEELIEMEFCGGTDFTVLAVKQAGFSWMVLFEKDSEQYVRAIGEVCTSFTICDIAVWERLEH